MKTLHKFILKSYLGPFALTFCISIFVLLMQFIWKYIDDLVGKGLEWYIVGELMFYVAVTMVPMALPLAILLSSIMTFGNLGEHFELVSLKSAGLSLQRIMLPLTIVSVLISATAFVFSNNVLPIANLKMNRLLYDVRESKPAFNLKEGVFYNGIEGYSIRVGKKHRDNRHIEDVMIYDHTKFQGNNKSVFAESGVMETTANKRFLVFTLNNGYGYEDVLKKTEDRITRPFYRNKFDQQVIRFDLSGFRMQQTEEELFKNNYRMLNVKQLQEAIDSLETKSAARKVQLATQLSQFNFSKTSNRLKVLDSLQYKNERKQTSLIKDYPRDQQVKVLETAKNLARSGKTYIDASISEVEVYRKSLIRHKTEWHKKFTLSFACLVLFFIGAPLGAIIRKGGLGMPVVVSVIFFIIFHVLSIIGEKSAKEAVMEPYEGMWLASMILFPIGVFLTYKASADSAIFDMNVYTAPFKSLFNRKAS